MDILGMGIDYTTGRPFFNAVDAEALGRATKKALYQEHDHLLRQCSVINEVSHLREAQPLPTPELNDPRAAGWNYLISADDPRRAEIIEILRPLALWRGMIRPESPLIYTGDPEGDWRRMTTNYVNGKSASTPFYILIVGGPERVPFSFQSLLQSTNAVGRVEFDTLPDLQTYVTKVLRLEQAPEPLVKREALFFAPEAKDATYYSRHYLAQPLSDYVCKDCAFQTHNLMGQSATKAAFLEAMTEGQPALVFVAAHGMVVPHEAYDIQKRFTGAICCQQFANKPREYWTLAAEDLPHKQPLLDGAVVFQFTCHGYGAPAHSEYAHWSQYLGKDIGKINAATDMLAALPQHLLALPHGPLAFIGHVDAAWVCGFHDTGHSQADRHWSDRREPFANIMAGLLRNLWPIGRAMEPIRQRHKRLNENLLNDIDRLRRGDGEDTPTFWEEEAPKFLLRNDAKNFMIFGDPAVRLRVPTAD